MKDIIFLQMDLFVILTSLYSHKKWYKLNLLHYAKGKINISMFYLHA